jgi:transaldolase/glucose-6-phosphate isomerase
MMPVNNDTEIQYVAGDDTDAITEEIFAWQQQNKIARLWAGDATLWTNSDEGKWLGWLDVAAEKSEIPRITTLAMEVQAAGFSDIVLMGMGGSSLCPAMIAATFGKIKNYPRLHILDSTDPAQIRHLEDRLDLQKTFFIVSSKSGSTLEPNIFKDYFYTRLQTVLNRKEVGNQFIAITDPGTTLETLAKKDGFKAIFYGVPSIGGRYSALSNFGMVPAGLMGLDLQAFLQQVEMMRHSCAPAIAVKDNPGAILGIILGVCAKRGKNKVTLIVSPEIHTLGAWLEQLLAESTGKQGKGLIPVDQEPIGEPSVYGQDRLFVYIRLTSAPDLKQDQAVATLEKAGFVVVRLSLPNKMHLGAELFRWEIATDVAGSIIGIDPFNQPDVEESKVLTLQLTQQYEQTGQLQQSKPFFSADGITLFTDENNLHALTQALTGVPSLEEYLRAHFSRIKPNDYVDLSAFIEMSTEHARLLQESRVLIRDHKKIATCLGFGPRFLHSTGQAYKGGANTGVFLQITCDASEDLPIPSHRYTFGVVIAAQAQADFAVLVKRSRRVLRVHLGKEVSLGLQQLHKLIASSLATYQETLP